MPEDWLPFSRRGLFLSAASLHNNRYGINGGGVEFYQFNYIRKNAEKFITKEKYQTIKKLLNGESYGDISCWGEEVRQIGEIYHKLINILIKEDSNYPYSDYIIYRVHISILITNSNGNTIEYYIHLE